MPQPTSINTIYAWAMGQADGCPGCVYNVEPPVAAAPSGSGWLCRYECSDCGTTWTTTWSSFRKET